MTTPDPVFVTVAAEEAGMRLDRLLAARVPDLSRARAQILIAEGCVGDGARPFADANHRVKAGDVLRVRFPEAEPAAARAEPIPLAVVYEDEHLLVIDKPAGMVVHPAPGHDSGTLVNALIAHCGDSLSGIGGVRRPGVVHRLDKDTSGLLVVAKTEAAHQGLAEQFASHGRDGRLKREYVGVCWGVPDRRKGVMDAPIERSRVNRQKMAVVPQGTGRHAVTRYAVAETFRAASLMKFELETGRTHQIRVHMAYIGHPLLGDATYGAGFKSGASRLTPQAQDALRALDRQALHAARLGFEHPVTGRMVEFESLEPDDLARLVAALRATEG